jgi:hypothetical protein
MDLMKLRDNFNPLIDFLRFFGDPSAGAASDGGAASAGVATSTGAAIAAAASAASSKVT